MVYVLFGPPGAGKGTQSELLAKKLNAEIIAPGAELRELEFENKLPNEVAIAMKRGDLVDDKYLAALMEKHLSKIPKSKDVIFDGYPRNIHQVKTLEALLSEYGREISKVIYLNTTERNIVHRVSLRRICTTCGTLAPSEAINCLNCSGDLVKRSDDELAAFSNRVIQFMTDSKPLISYYKSRNKLIEVDGNKSIQEVFDLILEKIL